MASPLGSPRILLLMEIGAEKANRSFDALAAVNTKDDIAVIANIVCLKSKTCGFMGSHNSITMQM